MCFVLQNNNVPFFRELSNQAPAIPIDKILDQNIADSDGLLRKRSHFGGLQQMEFVFDDGGPDESSQPQLALQPPAEDDTFSISSSILVPGVKHMLDNIQKDTLSKLSWYSTFSVTCLRLIILDPF